MKKILIVDDSFDVRNMLAIALRVDYILETVENGADALRLTTLNHYDLIITDYEMPIINGLELTRKILDAFPDLPVILMTGNEEVVPLLRQSGAKACLKKPLNLAGLKLKIKELLD